MSKAHLEPAIAQRLCDLLGLDVTGAIIEPLSGGLSNRSFRLSHGSHGWAVRLPFNSEEQRFETLDPASEQGVLVAVAQASLTPDFVLYDPGTGALVTRYLERAVPWTAAQARLPENLGRIAATLRSLHGLKVSPQLSPFRAVMLAERYMETARRSPPGEKPARLCSAEERRWGEELQRLAGVYEANFPPTALCHHDLVAANILDEGKLWLVDFEYALLAHPILDLASLAGLNDYDSAQQRQLVEEYFQAEPVPFRNEQLDEVIRLERLLSYFWAMSRWDSWPEPNDMSRFADSLAAMLR